MIELVIAAVGLLLSAFFSMAETVFVTVNKIQLEVQQKRKVRGADTAFKFLDNPETFLSTSLVGTDIANIMTTSFATVALIQYLPDWAVLLVISVVILVFGEILPKTIGRETAGVSVTLIAPFLKAFQYLFYPLIGTVQLLGRLKFFKEDGSDELQKAFSKNDLRILFDEVGEQGIIDEHESKFIANLLNFNEVTASEVMTPRTNIDCVSSDFTKESIIVEFNKSEHSKILIYKETLDSIIGVVLLKDLINSDNSELPIMRDVRYVPESKPVDEILEEMQREKLSVVVVVDEYGGTAGIMTIEDILEEIFGEFDLEDQGERVPFRELTNGDIIINGDAELDLLREELGINFPDGEYETIAGLLTFLIGKIPGVGEKILIGDRVFRIISASNRAIKKVNLKRKT